MACRSALFLLILVFLFSCKQKDACTWRTVADLEKRGFSECPGSAGRDDSMFIYMNHFSGGYDSVRIAKGIPALPGEFLGEVFSVDNQVTWHNPASTIRKDIGSESYLDRKLIEWSKDTLKYEITNYNSMNRDGGWLAITYFLDTISKSGNYLFEYSYSDKTFAGDSSRILTKIQSDSILKSWGLNY